jgi:hypothetical protein
LKRNYADIGLSLNANGIKGQDVDKDIENIKNGTVDVEEYISMDDLFNN